MRALPLLLALVAAAPWAQARVFRSLGPAAETGEALQRRAGWDLAFQTRMDIDGARSTVQVFQSTQGIDGAEKEIRGYYAHLGAPVEGRSGRALAWLVAKEGDFAVQYLIDAGETGRQALITRIATPESDFNEALRHAPARHRLDTLPEPGNATPLLHQREVETGFQVEVSRGNSDPDATLADLERRLGENGWQKALPGPAGMCIFQKGRDIAVISVKADPQGGCLITRAHKPQ